MRLRLVKFETTINDRIDFHKEEPISRNIGFLFTLTYISLSF